jgi:hypothetical protein
MPGSIETAAWRLGQMTAADSEIWDFWIAHRDGALRSSLVRHSFSSDYRDLELIRLAVDIAQYESCAIVLAGHNFRGG